MISEKVLNCLSPEIQRAIIKYPIINEIRMRKNAKLCITVGNKNIVTDHTVTVKEIAFSVNAFCKNSLHTYFDSIKCGFIPFDDGCRVGVCGKAVTECEKVINISEITSVNVRLPSVRPNIPKALLENVRCERGLLIYSPPCFGKTTLLREIIRFYSSPPYNKRIAVIDSRNELFSDTTDINCNFDVFAGYPKALAIDIAVRTMSPEIIVCDEIGLSDDTNSLIECKNCGVNLICTAHAKSVEELLNRKNIKILHDLKVFGGYLGITVKNSSRVYEYKKREDVLL